MFVDKVVNTKINNNEIEVNNNETVINNNEIKVNNNETDINNNEFEVNNSDSNDPYKIRYKKYKKKIYKLRSIVF